MYTRYLWALVSSEAQCHVLSHIRPTSMKRLYNAQIETYLQCGTKICLDFEMTDELMLSYDVRSGEIFKSQRMRQNEDDEK